MEHPKKIPFNIVLFTESINMKLKPETQAIEREFLAPYLNLILIVFVETHLKLVASWQYQLSHFSSLRR